MVVAQSRDAALAGVAVLDAGGSAADAAVATAFALAACEPWNSGLGGIGFALVQPAGAARAECVDFGPRAPRGLTPDRFTLTGRRATDLFAWPEVEGDANIHGPLSFAVPSSVAGYGLIQERWGRLPLRDVMAPGIALARRGLPQDWFATLKIASSAAILRRYAESARIYLPNGLPPVPPYAGPLPNLALGRLAETMERLATAGLSDFYTGEVAASLVRDVAEMGGVLGADDLAGCVARVGPCQDVSWGGQVLQVTPGLTAGPTLARVAAGLSEGAQADAAWFVALARAMKAAYAERLAGVGDAEAGQDTCTTHITVCDAEGGMVAMTTTLLSSMGSRVVLPGTGVLMNNGVMWFDPEPGKPNSVGPGKRPLTNMCPVILRDGDRAVLAAGASGGRRILASVVQLVAFATRLGMTPEQAAHHPRIDVSDAETVHADDRLDPAVIAALAADGAVEEVEHTVLPVSFACPNMILMGEERVGVSDVMSPWSAAVGQA